MQGYSVTHEDEIVCISSLHLVTGYCIFEDQFFVLAMSTEYCAVCLEPCKSDQMSICCDECNLWVHFSCTFFTVDELTL